MKYLLILFLSVSITEANDIINKRESQVTALRNTLDLVNKVEYSYGDAEGIIKYFRNNDGTKKRIVKKNDGGSYGSSTCEYFAIEDKLIYYKVLEHAWFGDTTNRYSLSEIIYYFSDDSTGLKTERNLVTYSEDLKEENIFSLENLKKDTLPTNPSEYSNIFKGFQHLETQNLENK